MPAVTLRRRLVLLAAPLLGALASAASAEPAAPILVGDLSPGSAAYAFVPRDLTEIGGLLYFSGNDPEHGDEPWVSDGTAAGTRRLADLCPGLCSSSPLSFTALGERVVFRTLEGERLYAISQAEVAASAEVVAEELAADLFLAGPFLRLGDVAYLATGPDGETILRTDGTVAGTGPTADLCLDEPCAGVTAGTADGRLYFSQGGRLAVLAAEGEPQPLIEMDTVRDFTPAGAGRVVFRGCVTFGCWAYVSDGTPAGTRRLEPSPQGSITFGASHFVPWRGRIYFTDQNGRMLSTDGTPEGTQLETSFVGGGLVPFAANAGALLYAVVIPGETGATLKAHYPDGGEEVLVAATPTFSLHGKLGERIFLRAYQTLMATDGTAAGTRALERFSVDSSGVAYAGAYYFGLDPQDDTLGRGLWRSDGTPAGTARVDLGLTYQRGTVTRVFGLDSHLVARLDPSSGDLPRNLYRIDPRSLEISAVDPARQLHARAAGREIFYAGDAENARLVAVSATAATPLPGGALPVEEAVAEDGRLFYTEGLPGIKLIETDGTVAGTRVDFDLRPGYVPTCGGLHCHPYFPQRITPSGDRVYFVGPFTGALGGPPQAASLWAWRRGQSWPTELLGLGDGNVDLAAAPGGRLVFVSGLGTLPGQYYRLFSSDGTAAGTRPFFDFEGYSYPSLLTAAGPRVFFKVEGLKSGLWVTDLTTAGTVPLAIGVGTAISELAATGDHLFFAGKRGIGEGSEPGFSDGTAAGTRWLDLVPGRRGSSPIGLHVLADGRAVFAAAGDAAGQEPWISDGRLAGTYRLTDLAPGPASSAPRDFAAVGNRLFFNANDGQSGRELWALDLPAPPQPCPAERLCLHGGRFEVTAEVQLHHGGFVGRRRLVADESGVFSFFSENNWEVLVKVLDGCAINDRFWVYAAAASDLPYLLQVHDRDSGETWSYTASSLSPGPILDGAAFATCGAAPGPRPYSPVLAPAPPASRCPGDPGALCLGPGGRYRVELAWRTAEAAGPAHPVEAGSADSGLFSFFSPANWESMVKVLDGCAINGKIWVFAAAATDVGLTLEVTDSGTGAVKTYASPLGTPALTVSDTEAFDCP